jgi:TRAP transporter 4TM/12TM fusion protein
MMIHFEAKKLGLKGLPKDAIPNFFKLILRNGYLLLPIVVLVIAMNYFSAGLSACFAILGSLVVSLVPRKLDKKNAWRVVVPVIPVAVLLGLWLPFGPANMSTAILVSMISCVALSFLSKDKATLTPKVVIDSLEGGAKNTVGVAVACGMAGLISGVVTMTALGQILINTLVPIAENSTFLALFLTMICCIVLGMGVPTTANYVIMATITAPILIRMGLPVLAAHMFVFYFGIVADITPPVALAAYAGSAIAKSNPMKTGVTATRLAITAFIVPYIFAYSPEMLLIGAKWYDVVLIVITSLIGIYAVSAGMEGYMYGKCPWWQRIMLLGGGLLSIIPGIVTDVAGIVLIAAVILLQKMSAKKSITPPEAMEKAA